MPAARQRACDDAGVPSDVEGDELEGFGPTARRAVAAAELEAQLLGHGQIGTEHLLLGLLADEAGAAAGFLHAAGAALGPARHKVSEAVGPPSADSSAASSAGGSPARTARAVRALARARRFAHVRHAAEVEDRDVLVGMLDVEGTAGQVLRGIGVDVERLRASLQGAPDHDPPGDEGEAAAATATCPFCGADLARALAYRTVVASGPAGPRDAVTFSCGTCLRLLGVTSA